MKGGETPVGYAATPFMKGGRAPCAAMLALFTPS